MKNNGSDGYKALDLVLIGGGHSHVQVLNRLAMAPVRGLRLTVISREVHTPYSGMLPGFVAGHYRWDDIHIDLAPLAARAGARLIPDAVQRLDLENNQVYCGDRPPVRFDLLSINSGAAPSISKINGADRHGISVKPIHRFLPRWQQLLERLRASDNRHTRLAVVGGGAGGVELALSIRYPLREVEGLAHVDIVLVTADRHLLVGHNPAAQAHVETELARADIEVIRGARIVAAEPDRLKTDDDETIVANEVLWVTQVSPQQWPVESGLAADQAGFVRINEHLQSVSHPHVFAAGDVAGIDGHPRPKAGVYAVRQGPVLADNLARAAAGRPLRSYHPQEHVLALISTGDRRAIVSHERFTARGAWAWHWKSWIDRRFMARFKFNDKTLKMAWPKLSVRSVSGFRDNGREEKMRCGGGGSKLGNDLLARVLSRLKVTAPAEAVTLIGDDAAVLRPVLNSLEVQTIDGFRAMLDDPYTVGRIAAESANNDVFAMGGMPRTALAWVTVPYAADVIMEDDLFQLMTGALRAFDASAVSVIGGHSSEGPEMSAGFSITGTVDERDVWYNNRVSIGDLLVLTKPVGTGVLIAAHMRARCRAEWLLGAIESMLHSNQDAVPVFRGIGVRACTDVAGFGLLGHVGEMARAAKLSVEIWPGTVPVLAGAQLLMADGIDSSLQAANEKALAGVEAGGYEVAGNDVRLLCDPQTSGGLVAAVKSSELEKCIGRLRLAGYRSACVIGKIRAARDDGLWGQLVDEAGIKE
jgi:selenide,water dikinase